MALFQALLAALFRSMGSILNTAFGWATLMLFGRTPRKRRTALSIVSLGSVLWIIALLGVLSPSIASFLLAFITVPEFLEKWMRALMILLVATIPLGVGVLTRHLHPGPRAARGPSRAALNTPPTARIASMLPVPALWCCLEHSPTR